MPFSSRNHPARELISLLNLINKSSLIKIVSSVRLCFNFRPKIILKFRITHFKIIYKIDYFLNVQKLIFENEMN